VVGEQLVDPAVDDQSVAEQTPLKFDGEQPVGSNIGNVPVPAVAAEMTHKIPVEANVHFLTTEHKLAKVRQIVSHVPASKTMKYICVSTKIKYYNKNFVCGDVV
jgi:hypothetical protein